MNNASENQTKDRILKSLAVGGFIGLIIIIAWLSIKMVAYLPTAMTSLASLADSVYNYKPANIIVISSENIVNVNEPVTISWNVPTQKGTFAFSYTCIDGVVIDMTTADTPNKSLACATIYNIGGADSITIVAQSEKERFVDIPYMVDFIPSRSTVSTASSTGSITIINASISPIATSTDDIPTEETPVVPEIVPEPTVPTTTPTTIPPKPTTPKPEYIQEYIYSIPTSNPNGFTDLASKLISTGNISTTGAYLASGSIDNDATGAIQFEVKNFGTKTSDSWKFIAKLPNGDTYTSDTQTALKPNERAIITVGFSATSISGTKTFSVATSVPNDTKLANNSFTGVVLIID